MTDKDNILIEDFFRQTARQQIDDNGFTERVMAGLETRTSKLCRLWTWGCIGVGALLFFFLNGWETLMISLRMLLTTIVTALEVFVTTAPTADVHLSLLSLLLLMAFVTVYLPYQTFRRLSAIQ